MPSRPPTTSTSPPLPLWASRARAGKSAAARGAVSNTPGRSCGKLPSSAGQGASASASSMPEPPKSWPSSGSVSASASVGTSRHSPASAGPSAASSASSSASSGRSDSGATQTRPACRRPAPVCSPGLSAIIVTVWRACMTGASDPPTGAPRSASSPLGTSMASTGTRARFTIRTSPATRPASGRVRPMPKSPSMIRAGSAGGTSPSSPAGTLPSGHSQSATCSKP